MIGTSFAVTVITSLPVFPTPRAGKFNSKKITLLKYPEILQPLALCNILAWVQCMCTAFSCHLPR